MLDRNLKSFSISFFLSDMKPLKKKLLEKPLTDTAAVTEEGPGIGNIFIFFLTHSSTITLPGSDNAGVPASETNETI